jgi:mannose-6-phosphate isomerase-like protein (cupin superfamily)
MDVSSLGAVAAFTTKDGSTIRELHHTGAQSLAEAELAAGQSTQRHYHAETEEIYFVSAGRGEMEVDGRRREVGVGDAILIPPGTWHEIRALEPLRILCCCVPPYRDDDTFFE